MPLREEIEPLVGTYGWQKTTLMKMRKLDSFVKESLRYHSSAGCPRSEISYLILVSTTRKVMQPFTFSDGQTLSRGDTIASPVGAIHMDDSIYHNPHEFDGFRFSKLREHEGESAKHHSVNTSTEYLSFGHGEHAWYFEIYHCAYYSPGRFFAANQIKLMLAFLLLRYDFTTEKGVRPANLDFFGRNPPSVSKGLLIRRRA